MKDWNPNDIDSTLDARLDFANGVQYAEETGQHRSAEGMRRLVADCDRDLDAIRRRRSR